MIRIIKISSKNDDEDFSRVVMLRRGGAGFTLAEVLVYLAIFSLIFVVVISASISLFQSYNRIIAKRELDVNAQNAMISILREIKFASAVYTPTSVFNYDNGQLSVATSINPPSGETSTYTDIYLDNYRVYVKHESQLAVPLTSEKVKVTALKFLPYNASDKSNSVSVILTIENNLPENLKESLTIRSGATVRGNYE